jgi:hypothetical protein
LIEGSSAAMFLIGIPLLLLPFVLYNMFAFLTPGVSFGQEVVRLMLPSQAEVGIAIGDIMVMAAVLVLLLELIKTARWGRNLVDHLLAILLFAGMAAEFALVRQAATATFLALVIIAFVDVISGFSISRRRRAGIQSAAPSQVPSQVPSHAPARAQSQIQPDDAQPQS